MNSIEKLGETETLSCLKPNERNIHIQDRVITFSERRDNQKGK